ncbi:hypothetical protein QUF63_02555 [Anaerolineales bacterium HSG25]|nr:hypothetical protein [Anaerolineales bacterium HSG25]
MQKHLAFAGMEEVGVQKLLAFASMEDNELRNERISGTKKKNRITRINGFLSANHGLFALKMTLRGGFNPPIPAILS